MNIRKSLLTVGLASAMLPMTTCAQGAEARVNPLLEKSTLSFGAPDFTKIQPSDYLPAIEKGIAEARGNPADCRQQGEA